MRATLCLAALLTALPAAAQAEPVDYSRFLSRSEVGADAFTRAHPTWDGRGVVIAILDTGVDPSVPGLERTPDGAVKVIEARDFTGEGDVPVSPARVVTESGTTLLRTDAGFVHGHAKLTDGASAAGFYLGFFDEAALKNGAVTDVNRNGATTDKFAVVAFTRASDGADVYVVDTDADGDIADEVVRRSYKDEPVWFSFKHPDPRKNQTPVAFAGTVLLDKRDDAKVELHFDDGGHGTHCAGIAAGHEIHGRKGFDGIAPGAKVMSLKIGHNALSGGATTAGSMKAALAYAAKWSLDHDVPVVINLSYGIGSEIEGASDIDHTFDEVLAAHRKLAASVSAGNEGPGLSTVGTPAAARLVWTAGALLNPANAEALWGGRLSGPRLFAFSSRGGELAKPDGVTPGVAWSSVPPFLTRAVMAGTSMASPQSAGVHALLVSAAEQAGVPWTSGRLKRAMKAGAKPVRGYTAVEQGAGLVQVGPAWKALRQQARHRNGDMVLDWRVSTAVPHAPGVTGTASYWRVGAYLPEAPHTVDFEIAPIFFADVADKQRGEHFETISLASKSDWLDVNRGQLALRGDDGATISLRMKPGRLRGKPGVHVGRVQATVDGVYAFDLQVVAVVPHRFGVPDRRTFKGALEAGEITRTFVEVPRGATAMQIAARVPTGRFGDTWVLLYDPDGRSVQRYRHRASSKDAKTAEILVAGDDLAPGIWEVNLYSSFRNRERSHYEMEIGFRAVNAPSEAKYSVSEDKRGKATVTLTQRGDDVFRGAVEATVVGIQKRWTAKIKGDKTSIPLALSADATGMDLWLEISKDDYNRFTDIAVNLLDGDKVVAQDAFGSRYVHLEAAVGAGNYTLEIIGGTTHVDDELAWEVEITALHREAPMALTVASDVAPFVLYPHVPTELVLTAPRPFAERAEGYHPRVDLKLTERGDDLWFRAPLILERAD